MFNETKGILLAGKVNFAHSFFSRAIGLMFKREFPKDTALVIEVHLQAKNGIHTFFMFFPIDVLFLDRTGRVVELIKELKPWRFYFPKQEAKWIVELQAGTIKKTSIEIGNQIIFQEK